MFRAFLLSLMVAAPCWSATVVSLTEDDSCPRRLAQKTGHILGESPALIASLDLALRFAKSKNAAVFIQGETGVGKELFAKAIHLNSPRRDKRFLAINVAALSDTLLESELFGHVKGSFTGATSDHPGLFEQANEGTLFLDEIGEISPAMQAKLLRVLETGSIRRVGAIEETHTDVRLVVATHRDLEKAVAAKQFREDLFYRINALTLRLPPLRERVEDIEMIAKHILLQIDAEEKVTRNLSAAALRKLEEYSWPGNVRQLRNVLTRAALTADHQVLLPTDLELPETLKVVGLDGESAALSFSDDPLAALIDTLDAFDPATIAENIAGLRFYIEQKTIEAALKSVKWNQAKAAKLLGCTRQTLRNNIKKFGVIDPRGGSQPSGGEQGESGAPN